MYIATSKLSSLFFKFCIETIRRSTKNLTYTNLDPIIPELKDSFTENEYFSNKLDTFLLKGNVKEIKL